MPAGRIAPRHLSAEPGAVPSAGAADRYGPGHGVGVGMPPLPLGAPSGLCLPLCHLCLVAEILVLGTGDRVEQLHPAVLRQMRLCGIAVEVQDTVRRDPSPWLPALSAQ